MIGCRKTVPTKSSSLWKLKGKKVATFVRLIHIRFFLQVNRGNKHFGTKKSAKQNVFALFPPGVQKWTEG